MPKQNKLQKRERKEWRSNHIGKKIGGWNHEKKINSKHYLKKINKYQKIRTEYDIKK